MKYKILIALTLIASINNQALADQQTFTDEQAQNAMFDYAFNQSILPEDSESAMQQQLSNEKSLDGYLYKNTERLLSSLGESYQLWKKNHAEDLNEKNNTSNVQNISDEQFNELTFKRFQSWFMLPEDSESTMQHQYQNYEKEQHHQDKNEALSIQHNLAYETAKQEAAIKEAIQKHYDALSNEDKKTFLSSSFYDNPTLENAYNAVINPTVGMTALTGIAAAALYYKYLDYLKKQEEANKTVKKDAPKVIPVKG